MAFIIYGVLSFNSFFLVKRETDTRKKGADLLYLENRILTSRLDDCANNLLQGA
jgi:hypothetical protein